MIKNLLTSYRKVIFSIFLLSLVLSLAIPFGNGAVSAQTTKGEHTVYLPLVSKNYQEWLDLFNQYRRAAGLNPVVSNDSMNYGLKLHVDYLIRCPQQKDSGDDGLHREDVCDGWTQIGRDAGSQSNMLWATSPNYTVKQSIDLWMRTDRHRYHMLNPSLVESCFSLDCKTYDGTTNCFAGVNVLRGLVGVSGVTPVYYPGANQTNVPPIAFPISVGFYPSSDNIDPIRVSKFILYDANGKEVSTTRKVISGDDEYVKEVVITPNSELLPNHRYWVDLSVSAGNQTFSKSWYFTTGSE